MKAHVISTGMHPKGFEWRGKDSVDKTTGNLIESIVGADNFKNIWWMEKAIDSARHVARVKMPNGSATGFLIGADIFMTNHHVFEDENDANRAILQFNYRLDADGNMAEVDEWECDPEFMFITDDDLDYSIVKVKAKDGEEVGDIWGYFNLQYGVEPEVNSRVNIIQHPLGRFKQIAFRDNQVKDVSEPYVQYLTDTDYGSSGSPVLDDWFNVVALHHQRVPDPNDPHRWYRNQGTLISAILAHAGDRIRK